MNRTKIEYLDYTLNLIVGCSGIGCAVREKCWAKAQAKRKKHYCCSCYEFKPHVHFERFGEPFDVKKSSRIGLNFMGETFDDNLPNRDAVWETILKMIYEAKHHIFLVLTKQPQNIIYRSVGPDNLWLGVTVNTKADLWRINELRQRFGGIRFVSFEPLYEDLGKIDLEGIEWVIIGAQTRPLLRPKEEWVYNIKCQAIVLGIPIFEKNNLGYSMPLKEFPKVDGGV